MAMTMSLETATWETYLRHPLMLERVLGNSARFLTMMKAKIQDNTT
jgi:hypothetical protein